MRRPLGCLTGSGVLAALLTAVAVGVAAAASGNGIFSPGDLNAMETGAGRGGVPSHAGLARSCAACHPAFWKTDRQADRCLACHTEVAQQLPRSDSLHGGLDSPHDCRMCHTEHKGEQGRLTAVALSDFPHEHFGFSLRAHQERAPGEPFECLDCHGEDFLEASERTCDSCHLVLDGQIAIDHTLAFGTRCLACHDGIDSYGASFDHGTADFVLLGKHQPAACGACHAGARDLDDLQSAPQACAACHLEDNIHRARLGTACEGCHTPAGWAAATFDHALAAYPLAGAHLEVACEDCHRDGRWVDIPQQCLGCHEKDDSHRGGLGAECETCHQPTAWGDLVFNHDNSAFPLTGAHVLLDCQQCHEPAVFRGTPTTCFGCHAADDNHQGKYGQDCQACHVTTSWSEVTFDHQRSRFPLTGAHSQQACTSCHSGGVFSGLSTACASCHREPSYHAGLFASDCGTSHNTRNWDASYDGPHSFPYDHGDAGGRCGQCHPNMLTEYTCFSCHDQGEIMDHHDEVSGSISNCVGCHAGGDKGDDD